MKYPGQLKNIYFRKLWFSDILVGSADNMEMIIISWVIISKTNSMDFHKWKKGEVLVLNKLGIPEPLKSKE